MSVRDAKGPGFALAGVAVVALVLGGVVVTKVLNGSAGGTARRAALVGPVPRWHDGYNHFILTVKAPLSPVATKALDESLHPAGDGGAAMTQRAGPGRPATVPARLAGAVKRSSHAGHAGSPASPPVGPDAALAGPGAQSSIPWQAVAPNPADPIVLHAGQPMSLLAKALARFPKGTTLERDSEGNLRAVLPPGWHWVPAQNGGYLHHGPGGGSAPRHGRRPVHVAKPAAGNLPPGWLPN